MQNVNTTMDCAMKLFHLTVTITLISIAFAMGTYVYPQGAKNYFDAGCRYYVHKNWEKAKENFLKDTEHADRSYSYFCVKKKKKILGNLDSALRYFENAVTRKMTPKYRNLTY